MIQEYPFVPVNFVYFYVLIGNNQYTISPYKERYQTFD